MKKLTLLLFAFPLLIMSCKKAGCNDQTAINYDETAEKGDASCKYEGKVMFYVPTANQNAYGQDTVLVMVNDVVIGKQSTDNVLSVAPKCNDIDVINYGKEMGETVSESFRYRITTKDSINLAEGQMNLIRSKCQVFAIGN